MYVSAEARPSVTQKDKVVRPKIPQNSSIVAFSQAN